MLKNLKSNPNKARSVLFTKISMKTRIFTTTNPYRLPNILVAKFNRNQKGKIQSRTIEKLAKLDKNLGKKQKYLLSLWG
jgi:hypothetical protein